ncbi:LOG family protein [Infirmifilum lucidum]|uniref:LOG family protein n=1 Tax=Infirmifilum lucidum TaxID=2776706 RepID=A0A7L9FIG9_9CREN|nr:LOG family protein [Infirmifilum lucidum]QOJ78565.1 LOG family protein [Infirmifilum lucidum]
MKLIGVACLGTEPPEDLAEKARVFVRGLRESCAERFSLALGGYWGLMRVVVDEALSSGLPVVLFPPLERENEHFPEGAIVIRTGTGFRLRSVVFVRSVDVLVALGGEAGTVQEVVTAYLEGKPVLVLGGTGFATDKLEVFSPYVDSRAYSEVRIIGDPKKLALEACRLLAKSPVTGVPKPRDYEGPRV